MLKWLKRIALSMLVLAAVGAVAAWWLLRGSLPTLDGELDLAGLSAPVSITRDHLGVVTIDAANEIDAVRALGYVHAQERYFEMDLMRRSAAGELAELFGPIALELDTRRRMHRMRTRVDADLIAIAGDKLPQLRAYTDGVNAGLAGLKVRPWPYVMLRQSPKRWLPADSALTGYAMYFDLQDADNANELALWKIGQHVPPALFALIARDGTSWDAPLLGNGRGEAVLPGAAELDLRQLATPAKLHASASRETAFVGSNNFAVSGALTADGRALVADDMHLGLRAPNIWFRARLRYRDPRAPGGNVDVQGFTLPGLPVVVVGSNGYVAWGFTNSYADTTDWARVLPCKPASAPMPASVSHCNLLTTHRETIRVAGHAATQLDVQETAWGPILQHASDGSALALRWTAHLPGAVNLGLSDLARVDSLAQALAVAERTAIPAQNMVVGDRAGRIAWRLVGPLPQRAGQCSAQHFVENTAGPAQPACTPWTISTRHAPSDVDPADARLWTANSRTVDGDALQYVGGSSYDLGARAQQVRDDLFAKQQFTERDLLAIQLDDRAVFLQRWWQLLRNQPTHDTSPALNALAAAATTWQGHASTDSVGYRIVRAWRLAVLARIKDGLLAPAQAALGADFEAPALSQLEGVAWPMVTQRPANLLPRSFTSWDGLLEDAAREVRDELSKQGPLRERTWGERNTAHICHPLAGAIPLLGKRFLCMPADMLRGDSNMPRVAAPSFGASQRMVVSPGHEADGIIHMPGGQSGHPMSPFWGAGHEDWVRGRVTSFLPGKTEHTLILAPQHRSAPSSPPPRTPQNP